MLKGLFESLEEELLGQLSQTQLRQHIKDYLLVTGSYQPSPNVHYEEVKVPNNGATPTGGTPGFATPGGGTPGGSTPGGNETPSGISNLIRTGQNDQTIR